MIEEGKIKPEHDTIMIDYLDKICTNDHDPNNFMSPDKFRAFKGK